LILEIKTQYAIPIFLKTSIEILDKEEIQYVIDDQLFLETLLMEKFFLCFVQKEKYKANEEEFQKEIDRLDNNKTLFNN